MIVVLLKPFLKHIKSFLRDNFDFLIKCPRCIEEDTEKFAFDIISLYASIPHDFGLEAFWLFFDYVLGGEELHPRFKKKVF